MNQSRQEELKLLANEIEILRDRATALDAGLLAYLLDMALIEARDQTTKPNQPGQ